MLLVQLVLSLWLPSPRPMTCQRTPHPPPYIGTPSLAVRCWFPWALASNVVTSDTTRPPVAEKSGSITLDLGGVAPNETKLVGLTLRFLPTNSGITPLPPPYLWGLIELSDGRFVNEYVNTLVVAFLAN